MKRIFTIGVVILFAACNNSGKTPDNGNEGNGIAAPQPITFSVDSVYPHDPKAFTQGLQYYKGSLYEGTG